MSIIYYTVPATGDGTKGNPIRPNIPSGKSFVGNYDPSTNTYLIAVKSTLPSQAGVQQQLPVQGLQATANTRGMLYSDVMKWFLG